ncbi:zinc finger BED domain-containing protein RICESLEEPER 2-like [Canna indica]|uniref:Zinc finger BED domain-containing protein RICESLEEPER 2-like n=1 Tax=Canna indica TaxID=4628 RepID=A0AAQ3JUV1_9LILI|nr:zinc finger BED domain-containing protein RICESLEEPER 2-like [Canna indica]
MSYSTSLEEQTNSTPTSRPPDLELALRSVESTNSIMTNEEVNVENAIEANNDNQVVNLVEDNANEDNPFEKRKRKKTSGVWNEFTIIKLSNGTEKSGSASVQTWKYDQAKMREFISHMVLVHELPFAFVEYEIFNMVMKFSNPAYEKISRATVKGSEYPTANLFLSELWRIKNALNDKIDDDDECVRAMARKMKVNDDNHAWIDEGEMEKVLRSNSPMQPANTGWQPITEGETPKASNQSAPRVERANFVAIAFRPPLLARSRPVLPKSASPLFPRSPSPIRLALSPPWESFGDQTPASSSVPLNTCSDSS